MHVEPAFEGRVIWAVHEAPLTPDWVGTTIYFDVAEAGDGAMLYFRHEGLTPELECYDMCHEGWTHYLAPGLLRRGRPDRRLPRQLSVHEEGRRDARDGARRAAHDRRRERLVGPRRRARPTWAGSSRCRSSEAGSGSACRCSPRRSTGSSGPSRRRRSRPSGPAQPSSSRWKKPAMAPRSTSATRASPPGSSASTCATPGWTHYLASLVSYAETGQGQPHRTAEPHGPAQSGKNGRLMPAPDIESPAGTDAVLRALADPNRREIIRLIQDTELPAGQIATHFTLTQQAVSQHLAVLKRAGLLEERRDGTRRLYRFHPAALEPVRDPARRVLAGRAGAPQACRRTRPPEEGSEGPVTPSKPSSRQAVVEHRRRRSRPACALRRRPTSCSPTSRTRRWP